MDKIVIRGGNPLKGEIRVNGAKNAALLIQCAALLGDTKTTLRHVPALSDVRTMGRLLEHLGCQVGGDRTLSIDPVGVAAGSLEAPYELVKTMRASICVLGPLLARRGRAEVSFPGGCVIGPRPVDLRALLLGQAARAGVDPAASSVSAWCTRCDSDRFFSHRAGSAGRQMGYLGVRDPREWGTGVPGRPATIDE